MSFPSWLLLPQGDILYAFQTSNVVSGKLVVFLLLFASVWAWTIMVSKGIDLKVMRQRGEAFRMRQRRERHPLNLFLQKQTFPESPIFKVYEKVCDGIGVELEQTGGGEAVLIDERARTPQTLSLTQLGAVRNAAEREIADQCVRLEKRMGVLATAVSASPMLGLLGTVWGVLDAFSSMATQGSTQFSAVAPGIASALMTTVVGLLVALPSAIGYNMLAGVIKEMTVDLDNFSDELISDIQRTFVRD